MFALLVIVAVLVAVAALVFHVRLSKVETVVKGALNGAVAGGQAAAKAP